MTDDKIAYAIKVMNESGIVVSGDALTLGIGAMTDARWQRFYEIDGRGRHRAQGPGSQEGIQPGVRQQGRREGVMAWAASNAAKTVAATATRPLISLRDIAKRYANGTTAVTGLDLDLDAGEFLSLLGPSGCGKSTVLRLIAGLGEPTAGSVEWSTGTARTAVVHDLGFVFQEPTLMPWATAQHNVMLPLTLEGGRGAASGGACRSGPGRRSASRVRARLPARTVGRHEDARVDRARPRDRAQGAAHGRTLRRARRDHAPEAERRPAGALAAKAAFTVVFVTHSVFESVYLSQRVVVMAARPGRVIADLAIDAPTARDAAFRTSPHYLRSCRAVSAKLVEAIAA